MLLFCVTASLGRLPPLVDITFLKLYVCPLSQFLFASVLHRGGNWLEIYLEPWVTAVILVNAIVIGVIIW